MYCICIYSSINTKANNQLIITKTTKIGEK